MGTITIGQRGVDERMPMNLIVLRLCRDFCGTEGEASNIALDEERLEYYWINRSRLEKTVL